jgi:exonuclease III
MNKKLLFNLIIILLFPFNSYSQITVDGYFDDWNNINDIYIDKSGDNQTNYPDLLSLKLCSNINYLYLNLILDKEFSIQNNSNIKIYIDNDNNPNTGLKIKNIGADIIWDFNTKRALFYHGNYIDTLNHRYIGLIPLPSFTSNQFEIAFNRNSKYGVNKLFPSDTIKLLISSNDYDYLPDNNSIEVILNNSQEVIDTNFKVKEINSDFRIMSLNCLKDKIFNTSYYENYKRILSSIDADIMCFEEIYDHTDLQTDSLVSLMIHNSTTNKYYSYRSDPDIVILSKYPIIKYERINGNSAYILDFSSINKPNILIIACHLAADNEDTYRQYEVNHILTFLKKVKDNPNAYNLSDQFPFIILGDLNSVGLSQQIKSLINGEITDTKLGDSFTPDWDNSSLKDLCPKNANSNTSFTWYSPYSDFAAGRMDYIIYSDSKLTSINSFVLFTDLVDKTTLSNFGLLEGDSKKISDHLPIVSDFKINTTNDVNDDENAYNLDNTTFNSIFNFKIYDYIGNEIYSNTSLYEQIKLLKNGVYFVRINYKHKIYIKKIII